MKTSMRVENGVLYETKEQDVEPILDRNARKRSENTSWKGEWHEVAEVPVVTLMSWLSEWGVTYRQFLTDEHIKAKVLARLNSNEFLKLRTKEGRI